MQTTRKRIISAAIDMIERDGIEAFSMRRLAAELGCGLMSLYHHVPSRSSLLDGIAVHIAAGMEIRAAAADSWQVQLRTQAAAFRRLGLAHPRCVLLTVTRPPAAACVMRPAESALATLTNAGLGVAEAVLILRTFAAYIIGSACCETQTREADSEACSSHPLRLRATEFPLLTELTAEFRAKDPDADFEFGLSLLMRAVAVLVSER